MEYDAETGLYHTWFRSYDSTQGRWLSVDPLAGSGGNPQSLDRYAYVLGDPVNLVDPVGLQEGSYEFVDTSGWWSGGIIAESIFQWFSTSTIHGYRYREDGNVWVPIYGPSWGLGFLFGGIELFEAGSFFIRPAGMGNPPVNPCYITNYMSVTHSRGIDITTADWRDDVQGGGLLSGHGTPVLSPVSGVVNGTRTSGSPGGATNFVEIISVGRTWTFRHVLSPLLPGMAVLPGSPLGVTDTSGNQTAAHIHLEIYSARGRRLNPFPLVPGCKPAPTRRRGSG